MFRRALYRSLAVAWLALSLPLAATAESEAGRRAPAAGRTLVVSPGGPYTTIQAALADAADGDVIEVRGGAYRGPLAVGKSVTLAGVGWPLVDGGGQGTVVTLAAPGIVFRGFEVRGSGVEPDRDHAGIAVQAPGVLVEGNRLSDVLFGIFVAQADDAVVRGNDIASKAEFEIGRKGDGIRLWYSQRVTVEGNRVHDTRDVVMWYAADLVVRDNVIARGRYGIHLMYCDRAQIEGNRMADNSVGIYTMYSSEVVLRGNDIRRQRGPSGYALGFKDADNVLVADNLLADNRAGIFLDGTPFNPHAYGRFTGNVLAVNDAGVILLPAVQGNLFEGNTFWENVEQVMVQGGGAADGNDWRGNYWSDYAGFDADGDGQGETPYRSERFFEGVLDREPRLRAMLYSPAVQAVEFAASTFPVVRPRPKLADPAPRVEPARLPPSADSGPGQAWRLWGIAAGLVGFGAFCGALAYAPGRKGEPGSGQKGAQMTVAGSAAAKKTSIRIRSVGKQYGTVTALAGVSFESRAGEALALWGPNGAGKTTLLKAILGLIDFQGEIEVEGHDVRRAGKAARRSIGYVPQEAVFYDWSVQATLDFYARLKGRGQPARAAAGRIPELLRRLELAEHRRKMVAALSGGQKQRLALALALLADPAVLLLDEPTASLDRRGRRDYLALLAGLRREGKTVIFASHRLEEVEALADRVLVLEGGRLVESLTPEALREQLAPRVEMTLWVAEAQRAEAMACLQRQGLEAHLNGRGTVVVRVPTDQKMRPLQALSSRSIPVLNFELE